MSKSLLALTLPTLLSAGISAQAPANLLGNTAAEHGTLGWRVHGQASVEEFDGNRCFVVRDGGSFMQEVEVPADGGKYLLLIGHVSGERTLADGNITDRPYLYGMTLSADRARILSHNQAETMRSLARHPNEWTKAWGLFEVPDGASFVSYQLKQGLRNGTPRNGSAARFDDVGLFVFETREAAEAFVARYR